MRPNPVQRLMIDLGAGRVSIDDAAEQLNTLLAPRRVRAKPRTPAERIRRIASDESPPYTPGSWDDVQRARITAEQYTALYNRVKTPPSVTEP